MNKVLETRLRRFRARRRLYRLQHPRRRKLTEIDLDRVLEGHQMWIGSGWEMGKRADLHRVSLGHIDLHGALLQEADLHGADLHHADLRDADLEGADLHRADLTRAKLHGAELRWADLHEADLHAADLHGADLKEADLHRADLRGAILYEADLSAADLRGANLSGVKGLTAEQLQASNLDAKTRLPKDLRNLYSVRASA